MQQLSLIQQLVVLSLPLIFAITVHEVAHGWVAKRLGDPTAMMLGRLTLNPLKHIDPVGTLLVPGIMYLMGGVVFGWAKPVPVTWENLRHPKRDMALVAAAGPVANLIMALMWGLVMKLGLSVGGADLWLAKPLAYMGAVGITLNIVLMIINLIPLPPLDGGRVLVGLLPNPWSRQLAGLEPYGFLIVLGLLILIQNGILGPVLSAPQAWFEATIYKILGL